MKPSRFAEVSPVTERMIQEINQGSANRTLFNLARFIPGSASPCFYGFCDSASVPVRWRRLLRLDPLFDRFRLCGRHSMGDLTRLHRLPPRG